MVDTGKVKTEVASYLEFMVKHSKKLILGINRREMEKGVKNYHLKVTDLSVPRNELEEIGKPENLIMWKLFGIIYNIITKIDNKVDKKELNYMNIWNYNISSMEVLEVLYSSVNLLIVCGENIRY